MKNSSIKRAVMLIFFVWVVSLFSSVAGAEIVFAFEKSSYEVHAKKSITLKPILQGAQAGKSAKYTWESDREDVATVSKGKVKGISAGSAQITCTLTDGDAMTLTASCTVVVQQPVTKITHAEKVIEIQDGTNYTFAPTVLPEDATQKGLRFFSSNETVAKVDDQGLISTVSRGKCVITAEAVDGSGVKLKQNITVQTFVIEDLDEIVLSERKTYTIELPELIGLNEYEAYNLRFKNENFELGHISFMDIFSGRIYGVEGNYFTINPKKAGKSTITLTDDNAYFGIGSPRAKHTITVIVEPSATYCEATFPKLVYDGEYAQDELVSFSGVIMEVKDEGYIIATKGKQENPVHAILPGSAKSQWIVGDQVQVYGAYAQPLVETTETGLAITTVQVVIEQMNGDNYNVELKEPDVRDYSDF